MRVLLDHLDSDDLYTTHLLTTLRRHGWAETDLAALTGSAS